MAFITVMMIIIVVFVVVVNKKEVHDEVCVRDYSFILLFAVVFRLSHLPKTEPITIIMIIMVQLRNERIQIRP